MFKVASMGVVFMVAVAVFPTAGQEKKQEQKPLSPTETIMEAFGGKGGPQIKIVYSRPYTKDPKDGKIRKIWGGLVPYGKPWRTGANAATALETEADLVLGGAKVPAGKYTIYTIPEEKGTSKLAISKTTGQPGEPVDDKNDLVRVDLKRDALSKTVDQFTIAIETEGSKQGGVLKLMWEDTQFSVPFTVAKKSPGK
jgi:hypothetical protein